MSNMTIKIPYYIKKFMFGRKFRSECYLLLPLYINWPTTKNLPTKPILKTINSSVRNPEEVEYDKQNWLQHQKNQSLTEKFKVRFTSYCQNRNRSIPKKFPIETI